MSDTDSRATIRRAMTHPNAWGHYTPATADKLLDAYAAELLRTQARKQRTEVYARVYEDAGQRAASGVQRAADDLDATAYKADPNAKPITDHRWWAGEGGQCWHEIGDDTTCNAPRIAHQLNKETGQ